MRTRKNELEKFLQMLVQHRQFSQSKLLEEFLKDQNEQFSVEKYRNQVEPQFSKGYLLELHDIFEEEGAIGDFRS